MDIPIQVWHMTEVMRRDFNEYHMTQVPMTENQLEEMQKMEEVSDYVGMNYHKIPDSTVVAQTFDDFLSPWEEAGSAEFPITKVEDECFSETLRPTVLQPPLQPRAALRSKENLQNFSAARQLFD